VDYAGKIQVRVVFISTISTPFQKLVVKVVDTSSQLSLLIYEIKYSPTSHAYLKVDLVWV